jgi:hypothetical protein
VALLLPTPEQRRGFVCGREIGAEIAISNFGECTVTGGTVVCDDDRLLQFSLACEPGEVRFAPIRIEASVVERPTRFLIEARAAGAPLNSWPVWLFPEPPEIPPGTVRLDGLPYSRKELEADFEERGYSSGWGLKCRTWSPILPHPEQLVFNAPVWRFDAPLPKDTRLIITHQLTRGVVEFMESGGRVVLLANKTGPGLSAKFINVWGQTPLILREPPLDDGSDEWISDLLHIDLFYRHPRAIAVDDLGVADQVDPIVGLIATSFDHTGAPGKWLLHRLIGWGAMPRRGMAHNSIRRGCEACAECEFRDRGRFYSTSIRAGLAGLTEYCGRRRCDRGPLW